MTIEIKGDKEIMDYLRSHYSESAVIKMNKAAINRAGTVMVKKYNEALRPYRDTGLTVASRNLYGPNNDTGYNKRKINWYGHKGDRYKLMHINEYGHFLRNGKFFTPPQAGLIENVRRHSSGIFREEIKKEIAKRV